MSWLTRGIIISIILLGIGALLLFPELTVKQVITPIIDSVTNKTDVKNDDQDREKNGEDDKPRPIIRVPITEPAPSIPISIEASDTQVKPETKMTVQMDGLQPPPNSLSESDTQVISLVNDINPKFKAWITPAEQIRKWVSLIDRAAQGKMSTKHRPLTFKTNGFKVITKDGRLYADPENHKSYNTLIDTITSVRPDILVSYYHYWSPIFDTAYAELGNGNSFSKPFRLAVENILAVKPLAIEQAELKKPTSIIYKYINPEIENNSEITKWVWRIGPENTNKLQNYLREFIRLLENE
jgi:hypothetical protein